MNLYFRVVFVFCRVGNFFETKKYGSRNHTGAIVFVSIQSISSYANKLKKSPFADCSSHVRLQYEGILVIFCVRFSVDNYISRVYLFIVA